MAKIHTDIVSFTEGTNFYIYKLFSKPNDPATDRMSIIFSKFKFLDNFCYIAEYEEECNEGEFPDGYEEGYNEIIKVSVGDTDNSAIWQYGQKMYF